MDHPTEDHPIHPPAPNADQPSGGALQPQPSPPQPSPSPTRTTFRSVWLIKILIIGAVLLGFGGWGLYDAIWVYPENGRRHAEFSEYEYLRLLQAADAEDPSLFPAGAPVPDPAAELDRLRDREIHEANELDAKDASSRRHLRATMELARRRWLVSLSRLGPVTPELTAYEGVDVRDRLTGLEQRWGGTQNPPAPIEAYDIPMQWVFVAVGFGFGLYVVSLLVRTAMTTYMWAPTEQRLTLPGGASIVPGDLAEVDKRKWDKFIVFLKIKPAHPTLGGRELRFDTYRLAHLEGWIIEMEKTAFPELAAQQDDGEDNRQPDGPPGDRAQAQPSGQTQA